MDCLPDEVLTLIISNSGWEELWPSAQVSRLWRSVASGVAHDFDERVALAEKRLCGLGGEPLDWRWAAQVFREFATKNHPLALFYVGIFHVYPSYGFSFNPTLGFELLRKSADKGCALAQVQCLRYGIGCNINLKQCGELLATLDHNNPIVLNELASMPGCDSDFALYKRAASMHLAAAENNYATLLGYHVQTDRSREEAEYLYQQAIDKQHVGAMTRYAELIIKDPKRTNENHIAFELCRRSAGFDGPSTHYVLGTCYMYGYGTPINRDEAKKCFYMSYRAEKTLGRIGLTGLYNLSRNQLIGMGEPIP